MLFWDILGWPALDPDTALRDLSFEEQAPIPAVYLMLLPWGMLLAFNLGFPGLLPTFLKLWQINLLVKSIKHVLYPHTSWHSVIDNHGLRDCWITTLPFGNKHGKI